MSTGTLLVGFCLLLIAAWSAHAQLVSNTLGSHMVLQRAPHSAHLWGWTSQAGERVKVTFKNMYFDVVSDKEKKWLLALPPTSAGGPYSIQVTAMTDKVLLEDVYFGDVWFCGGQSNMQFTVDLAFNATQEIALADRYPHIRLFTVGQGTMSNQSLSVLKTVEQPWSVANSTTVGGQSWKYFSATCWFFGKQLYDKFKVPIGLVSSNWGGTKIQAWSSHEALSRCKQFEDESVSVTADDKNAPSVLWNAMIVPFLDMVLRGTIWYQGESNANQPKYYSCAFPSMIHDWRHKFASANDRPFLFVQLAPWLGGANSNIADTRFAQESALELSHVGMATAIDLGDPTSPQGNIHPRNKQEVGRRLALVADYMVYGDRRVTYLNPRAGSAFQSNPMEGRVRVLFDETTIHGGLVWHNNTCPVDSKYCGGLELQLDLHTWVPAKGEIVERGTQLEVTAADNLPHGSRLTGVRYAWADWPVCTIFNQQGLPALQFHFLV